MTLQSSTPAFPAPAPSTDRGPGSPADMLDPIIGFGSGCFVVFGFIYLGLLHSTYMFLSNLLFGLACAATWYARRLRAPHGLQASLFLGLVYLGLVNVAVHVGGQPAPMVFWGLSVGIAAVFLYQLKGQLVWLALLVLFFPLVQFLKAGPCAAGVIHLTPFQSLALELATYLGLLTFLSYCFLFFRRKLDQARAQVKVLSGLLPICASCKRIRDDQGYWLQIEGYLKAHSMADFTHSLCPECLRERYPDFDLHAKARGGRPQD